MDLDFLKRRHGFSGAVAASVEENAGFLVWLKKQKEQNQVPVEKQPVQ